MKPICMVMVLRNEAALIQRCLNSVKPLISTWVIGDAGSTDGTQAKVKESMGGIPGALHQVEWVDIGFNWTQALKLASGKAAYHLLLDAEMILDASGALPAKLEADSYLIRENRGSLECWRERLFSDRHEWRCGGSAFPFFRSKTARMRSKLRELSFTCQRDGIGAGEDIQRKVDALKGELEKGANVARSSFYLAECYRNAGNLPQAIEYYESRSKMAGWDEETWYSTYQVARLQQRLGIAWMLVQDQYLRAYQLRPQRVEPIFHLARTYRLRGQHNLARIFSSAGLGAPIPDDLLFVERPIYEYGLKLEHALACQQVGSWKEAAQTSESILSQGNIPEDVRTAAEQCLRPRSLQRESSAGTEVCVNGSCRGSTAPPGRLDGNQMRAEVAPNDR